jgi:RNA polymerase sigma-70 factor, ECF subfamily
VAAPGHTFEGRSSVRAWLYRIATNVCLDALDRRARRILPTAIVDPADPNGPPAADDHETPWLQPVLDAMLDPADADADPSTVVIGREHVELAFIAAIQLWRRGSGPCFCCATSWAAPPRRRRHCSTRPPRR